METKTPLKFLQDLSVDHHTADAFDPQDYEYTESQLLVFAKDYANHVNTSQQQTIERLKKKASTLLSGLEGRKPKNGYIFSVRIAIQDLQKAIEEAEQLLNTTEQ